MAATTKEVPRPYGRGTSFVVSFVLALNRVNVVAVTTILVVHVGVIGHHVPCHYDFMFPRRSYHARLRARGVRGALPRGRGFWGPSALPEQERLEFFPLLPDLAPGGLVFQRLHLFSDGIHILLCFILSTEI